VTGRSNGFQAADGFGGQVLSVVMVRTVRTIRVESVLNDQQRVNSGPNDRNTYIHPPPTHTCTHNIKQDREREIHHSFHH